jgi:curved DNA-binding protein CbpA
MNDPYEVLGLERTADETEIRRRYLELVREFPPDRAPERFAEIRAAYDEARDPTRLLESHIFEIDKRDSLDALRKDLRERLRGASMPLKTLLMLAETP